MTDFSARRAGSAGSAPSRVSVSLEDGAERPVRVYRVRRSVVLLAGAAVGLAAVGLTAMIVSWGRLASEAHRAADLEAEVTRLVSEQPQVAELARELDSIASAYEELRSFFGTAVTPGTGDLWLPPSASRPSTRALPGDTEGTLPSAWPLTQAGFLTRSPASGGSADHPGIDIAVPAGSYVRAAGAGTVFETGEDEVYGYYVVLDHGDGYRSLYGHASVLLAVPGAPVRRGEVIALSGSSGSSSAPPPALRDSSRRHARGPSLTSELTVSYDVESRPGLTSVLRLSTTCGKTRKIRSHNGLQYVRT
jgi:murein DD-endopeptidase MepM/ murein hydrolase activator NlpD